MAKTKLRKPNDEDLKALASKLIDTSNNVYSVGEKMGLEIDDATFDELKKKEEIFRCEQCNRWMCVSMEDYGGMCVECCAEIG